MANETLLNTMLAATSLTSTFNGPAVDVEQYLGYYIQCNFDFSGGADSAGTIKLQTSIDGVNFGDYPNSTQNITNASTSAHWEVYVKFHKFVRVVWTNSSGTGGTGTILAMYTRELK